MVTPSSFCSGAEIQEQSLRRGAHPIFNSDRVNITFRSVAIGLLLTRRSREARAIKKIEQTE